MTPVKPSLWDKSWHHFYFGRWSWGFLLLLYFMSISFQLSLFLIAVIVIASAAWSYYVYRHTVPVVSNRKRWLLIALRALAFTLTLLALFEPLLTLTSHHDDPPAVAVLVDNSLSMSQQDKTGDRAEIVRSLLEGSSIRRLAEQSDVQLQKFSYSLSPLAVDSLSMDGGTTNISNALHNVVKNSPASLQSIVMISDGNYNAGSNPLYDAEWSRIPIYTVGIGDSSEQRDIAVSKIVVNSIGYVETSIPVDAAIKASGFTSRTVRVTLEEEGKKIDERNVQVPSSLESIAEVPVQFSYTPRTDGVKKLSVRVSALDDEITPKNNLRSSLIKVLKNKMKVTVIAGNPSADLSAVMQTLQSDKNIDAVLFLQMPNGELRSRTNAVLQQSLNASDCLVLIGFPTAQSSSSVIRSIMTNIRERSIATMFIAGRLIDPQKLQLMEPLFAFTLVSATVDEQSVFPAIVPKNKYHALVQMDAGQFPLFAWEKLPPVYASFQTFAAKPEAQTLLSVKIQGVTLQNPLLLLRTAANTKSIAFTGYGIHRWKLLAGARDETRGVFDVWFSSLVRWLATKERDSKLKVEPSQEFFSRGEPVGFTGEVYNENFQPIDNAEVGISIRSASNEQISALPMQSIGSGRYEGTAAGLPEGEYTYRAAALIGGDTVGTTAGRITIGEQSIEFAETKMNNILLRQIAQKSGGAFAVPSQIDSLITVLLKHPGIQSRERIETKEFELWNLPLYLSVIIALFATEWFLRKRWGML